MPFSPPQTLGGANVAAFLDMIAFSEIGPRLLAVSDNGYNVLVGATPEQPVLFLGYSDHPNVYDAKTNSTAAGRYQILHRFWVIYKQKLNLPDFGPASQDQYALQQLREQGALPLIEAGRFTDAVARARGIWASLPGAGYGQHENALASLASAYRNAGGVMEA